MPPEADCPHVGENIYTPWRTNLPRKKFESKIGHFGTFFQNCSPAASYIFFLPIMTDVAILKCAPKHCGFSSKCPWNAPWIFFNLSREIFKIRELCYDEYGDSYTGSAQPEELMRIFSEMPSKLLCIPWHSSKYILTQLQVYPNTAPSIPLHTCRFFLNTGSHRWEKCLTLLNYIKLY